MTTTTIYHNPRCSKSREALALLQARGQALQVVEYLKTPLDAAALAALRERLGVPVRELLRSGEEAYEALGLADGSLDEGTLLAAIAAHPALMQRPIVVGARGAVTARPPELALTVV